MDALFITDVSCCGCCSIKTGTILACWYSMAFYGSALFYFLFVQINAIIVGNTSRLTVKTYEGVSALIFLTVGFCLLGGTFIMYFGVYEAISGYFKPWLIFRSLACLVDLNNMVVEIVYLSLYKHDFKFNPGFCLYYITFSLLDFCMGLYLFKFAYSCYILIRQQSTELN